MKNQFTYNYNQPKPQYQTSQTNKTQNQLQQLPRKNKYFDMAFTQNSQPVKNITKLVSDLESKTSTIKNGVYNNQENLFNEQHTPHKTNNNILDFSQSKILQQQENIDLSQNAQQRTPEKGASYSIAPQSQVLDNLLNSKSLFNSLFLSNRKFSQPNLQTSTSSNLRQLSNQKSLKNFETVAKNMHCYNSPESLNMSISRSKSRDKIKPLDKSQYLKEIQIKKNYIKENCLLDPKELNFMNQKQGDQHQQLIQLNKQFNQTHINVMNQFEEQHQQDVISMYRQFNSSERKMNLGDPETNQLRYAEKSIICSNFESVSNISSNNINNNSLINNNISSISHNKFQSSDESQNVSQFHPQNENQSKFCQNNLSLKDQKKKLLQSKCQHLLQVMYCNICNRKIQSVLLSLQNHSKNNQNYNNNNPNDQSAISKNFARSNIFHSRNISQGQFNN